MKSRAGYSVMELIIVLSMLGIFSLVSTRLFSSTFKVFQESNSGGDPMLRFDSAMTAMRADVAGAASIDVSGANGIVIHQANGRTIEWRSDGKREVSRQTEKTEQRWDVGEAIVFSKEGELVLVRTAASDDSAAQIAMASTRELLARGAP